MPPSSGRTRHPARPEFDLFVKEVVREMTAKAGQKCTAIRRITRATGHGCHNRRSDIGKAGTAPSSATRVLTTSAWARWFRWRNATMCCEKAARIAGEATSCFRRSEQFPCQGADATAAPSCRRCCSIATTRTLPAIVHDVEAFGPVSTIMAYRDIGHAIATCQSRRWFAGGVGDHQ